MRQLFLVLPDHTIDLTNRRHPQANQSVLPCCGVALEITLQFALLLRYSQRVSGFSKMVHTNTLITSCTELFDSQLQQGQFIFGLRQALGRNFALCSKTGWHMGITE